MLFQNAGQFQNNVSQHGIEKMFNILSSTDSNIIKRF